MCHEYRVPQWEEPMRLVEFQTSEVFNGYIVKSGVRNENFFFETNYGHDVDIEDFRIASRIRIAYNGLINEINETNGKIVINTDCGHRIILSKIQSSEGKASE